MATMCYHMSTMCISCEYISIYYTNTIIGWQPYHNTARQPDSSDTIRCIATCIATGVIRSPQDNVIYLRWDSIGVAYW